MVFLHGALTLLLLAIGLLAPGWLLGRVCRTPVGLVGSFLGSAAVLFNLVLLLDGCGVALAPLPLGVGLAAICALLATLAARTPATAAASAAPATAAAPAASALPFRWPLHAWFLLPAALGLAAIALRATLDPLSGFDTQFRWDYLAREMLRAGSLQFYPPITAEDFLRYAWPDGIAPIIPTLYLWTYVSAGELGPVLTAPVVFLQAALLFLAVWQLAARHSRAAAAFACALLASSSVLLWGVAMGQETGLTALSLVALFLFIERHRAAPQSHWLLWAGLAAGTGALAREYGLIYLAFGVVALAWWRLPRRDWFKFLLAATAVALPWYLRNWVKTGHPLYSYSFGHLFPVNPVLAEYYEIVHAQFHLGAPESAWTWIATLGLGLAGAPLVGGLLGGLADWRPRAPWLSALLAMTGLWLWSVGQTAAGPGYAVRMLTPAIAVGAVLGGLWLARWRTARLRWGLLMALTVLSADAGMRSLYLPVEAGVRWWQRDAGAWRDFNRDAARWRAHPNWAAIADAAAGEAIVAPDPTLHALFVGLGARPVPLFSPAVRFLFEADADFPACLARLRRDRVRFILTTRSSTLNELQAARHPFFRSLRATPPTAAFSHYLIYDLAAPTR
jgi:hypothetical protein